MRLLAAPGPAPKAGHLVLFRATALWTVDIETETQATDRNVLDCCPLQCDIDRQDCAMIGHSRCTPDTLTEEQEQPFVLPGSAGRSAQRSVIQLPHGPLRFAARISSR